MLCIMTCCYNFNNIIINYVHKTFTIEQMMYLILSVLCTCDRTVPRSGGTYGLRCLPSSISEDCDCFSVLNLHKAADAVLNRNIQIGFNFKISLNSSIEAKFVTKLSSLCISVPSEVIPPRNP